MSTELIIRLCAPTLAGLKAGNLFSYHYKEPDDLLRTLELQNRQLNPKGVYFVLMRMSGGSAMIYVYRKKQLEQILCGRETQRFLRQFGYTDFHVIPCLERLKERLLEGEFPHDIGVFLDYPLADIQAFIDNKGANCPVVGCWKAYTNVNEAKRKFASFRKCTQIYCQQYDKGIDITRLTVAG